MGKIECFKIRILEFASEKDIFNIGKGQAIKTVSCLKPYFLANPITIVADPFLFVHNDRLYLFYESKNRYNPGVIQMISTTDLKTWSQPKTVLSELFHISFPYVFSDGGQVYMIPETGLDNSIRLYEAVDNSLSEFRLCKKLLVQPSGTNVTMGYADSAVVKMNDIYYLLTTLQYTDKINTLELYYSDSLKGEYKVHPQSPVLRSQEYGRNAGALQFIDGKLYRYSQDCSVRYGDNVNVSEVQELSREVYKEVLVHKDIFPSGLPFYKDGGHQYNMVNFKGHILSATDAKEYHRLSLQKHIHSLSKLIARISQ